MIHFNNQNTFKEIHYNSHDIKYIYGGCSGDLVWGKQTPGSKLRYTTTSGDTYTIPCDLTGVITSAEIADSMYSHDIPHHNYALSDLVVGDCVNRIDDNAFNDMYTVSSITIPNSVVTIGYCAFKATSISAITIPNSVTSIGQNTFQYCTGLTSIELPDSVTTIGGYCFDGCSGLTSVDIGSGITSIGDMAFWRCSSLTAITFNATTPPTIGMGIFGSETTYPIYVPCASVDTYKAASGWSTYASRIQCISPTPSSPKYVLTLQDSSIVSAECDATSAITSGEVATQYSGSVVSAEIGSCVTSIDNFTFYYCKSLTSATIPDSVTSIGKDAFMGCYGLTSIDIPSGVTSIGDYAFSGCTSLTSATIGSGVTSINKQAFRYCTSLTGITCLATTPPTLGNYVFSSTNECPIYVPAESLETYKARAGWSTYADRIQAII